MKKARRHPKLFQEDSKMGIYTGAEIRARQGIDFTIEPFREENINPNSYNLRLDIQSLKYAVSDCDFDCAKDNSCYFKDCIESSESLESFWLEPNRLYLASTIEHTRVNNCIPIIVGRSSLARLGLEVHKTAGFGDIGFNGFWTLQITCTNRTCVYDRMNIAQIYFVTPHGGIENIYAGKYQDNAGCQTSRLYLD